MYRPLSELNEEPAWEPPTRVEVDGEVFDVAAERDRQGQYHFDWVSGPNSNYGFAVGTSDGRKMSSADIEDAIRAFLAEVDPETGYIE
jgi:hypothetical protein